MWYQAINKNLSQLIKDETPEAAVERFHKTMDGLGIKYDKDSTRVIEVPLKKGITTVIAEAPERPDIMKILNKNVRES